MSDPTSPAAASAGCARRTDGMLFVTVFCTGGAIMVLELLGTRLIAPVYGVGLYVWSSLICVTLLALSVGYWFGGRLADRSPSTGLFLVLPLIAGVCTFFLPELAGVVLEMTADSGLRGGTLSSAFLLFTLPLTALGMATPFAVRLHSAVHRAAGTTAGSLYAVSTLGSIVATLLSGFFLVPALGVSTILRGTAMVLILVAGLGWLWQRSFSGSMTAVAGAALLGLTLIRPAATDAAPDGVGQTRFRGDSNYTQLCVIDTPDERYLLMDGALHTHVNTEEGVEPVTCEYVRTFGLLPVFRPGARRCLVLGLGGGSVLKVLEQHDLEYDIVEIDPLVHHVAERYFGPLPFRGEVHLTDAREFVRSTARRFDLVVIDVVSTDAMPEHLCSVEFFELLATVLNHGAVVAFNSIGEWEGEALPSLQRTLRAAFRHVRGYAVHSAPDRTNLVFFASQAEFRELPPPLAEIYEPARFDFPDDTGVLLTDDFNPINFFNAEMSYVARRDILEYLGRGLVTGAAGH